MATTVTLSFSTPVELSIQMEECMENTGFNRSDLIKTALTAYFKSREELRQTPKKIEDTYALVLEVKEMVSKLQK